MRTVGRLRVGDVGALVWVAEQLDVVGVINRACGWSGSPKSVSLGEMVLAVAVQRACAPAGKCHLGAFLGGSISRVSCLPAEAFTGQIFHRLAMTANDGQLESAQLELARAAVSHFKLGADVLAFDTTNFDTHIATVTPGRVGAARAREEQALRPARGRPRRARERNGTRAAAPPDLCGQCVRPSRPR